MFRLCSKAHPIRDELVLKACGPDASVSPIVTVEPRRRKFHRAVTVIIPLPKLTGRIATPVATPRNAPGKSATVAGAGKDAADSLRLLCSVSGLKFFKQMMNKLIEPNNIKRTN